MSKFIEDQSRTLSTRFPEVLDYYSNYLMELDRANRQSRADRAGTHQLLTKTLKHVKTDVSLQVLAYNFKK
ncbi:hypothetical protein DS731_12055 [Alteromonas sp. RKMC-009]|nr:hypothetical protein DS731_12055 [Alteromonas sp. RKMC-009]